MRFAHLLRALLAASVLCSPAAAQTAARPPSPSPGEIVAAAPASDWIDIASDDLLVMTLAPDAKGKARRVVIQLISAPFSAGWVSNIKALARAHWYDGIAVVRVQDNYVAQWGDPDGEDPKRAKALPANLATMTEQQYEVDAEKGEIAHALDLADVEAATDAARGAAARSRTVGAERAGSKADRSAAMPTRGDGYADHVLFHGGWPVAADLNVRKAWPIHCYGTVGVGRGMSPDTGSGAELYAAIGHAPRHLDRNIAVVGRVIEGIEHLSSLPRGTGQLGFYETAGERTPIASARLASALRTADRPRFQYLSTDSDAFARYADARANRRDPFFIVPAGGADICNIPVPVRRRP